MRHLGRGRGISCRKFSTRRTCILLRNASFCTYGSLGFSVSMHSLSYVRIVCRLSVAVWYRIGSTSSGSRFLYSSSPVLQSMISPPL